MEIEKGFFRCVPPGTEKILLHTVVVLHYKHHIKWHAWSRGEGCQNAQKQSIMLAHLGLGVDRGAGVRGRGGEGEGSGERGGGKRGERREEGREGEGRGEREGEGSKERGGGKRG